MLPAPDRLQKVAMSLMLVLVMISFTFTNLYALFWTSSEWLVSTILPAVIVDLTNEERGQQSLQSLRHNSVLDAAAKLKAEHMAEYEYFAHFSPDNVSPWHWYGQVGYQYVHAGENLAIHFSDSDEVVQAWMESPTHRANIMNGQFAEIGIGTARGSYQGYPTTYVVQLFGTPLATPERTFPATVAPDESPAPMPTNESEPESELAAELAVAESAPGPDRDVAIAPLPPSNPPPPPSMSVLAAESAEEASTTAAGASTPTSTADSVTEMATDTRTETTQEPITRSESVPTTTTFAMTETAAGDVFFTTTLLTTTTSGTPATIGYVHHNQAPSGWHLLTQPEQLLQYLYMGTASVVVFLLLVAFVREAREHRPIRMAYSVGMLFLMGALWTVQSWLTTGALIV